MCKAIRDMLNDSKEEGRIEGSIIMCKKLGIDDETVIKKIKEEYHLSDAEIRRTMALYW